MLERSADYFLPQELAFEDDLEYASAVMEQETNPVFYLCDYRSFVSTSNGRDRAIRRPREVELYRYDGHWFSIKDGYGPLDAHATEVLGDLTTPDRAESQFLAELRRIPKLKQILRSRIPATPEIPF